MQRRTSFPLRLALGIAVILLAAFSALPLIAPPVVAADAPAGQFSAERAMSDLQVVAREPHSAGSEAQARVRAYIIQQLALLNLKAEIQESGAVSNILVRLPGTNPGQAVLVTGHYDSHFPAPGGGDDGLSTAAMLEAVRVLHASAPLRNDVLFLWTDGEEYGWLGARAFLEEYPGARENTGVVLCFDGRPGNAPLTLRQTSPGDAWLARHLSGLPVAMWAGSWTNAGERTDGDTDFETFQAARMAGFEIENEASGTRYHTDQDTAGAISARLMQSYGKTMITLANHFGSIDLQVRPSGPDWTYFSLPLAGTVAYPAWVMPIVSGLALAAFLALIVIGWRQGRFSTRRFLIGLPGLLLGILLIVVLGILAWGLIAQAHAAEIAANGGFEARSAWLAALMIAAVALMGVLLALLARRLGTLNVAAAGCAAYLLIQFAAQLVFHSSSPLTTAYIAWPLIGAVASMGVLLFARRPALQASLLALCTLFIFVLQVPYLWLGSYTDEAAWIPVLAACVPAALIAAQVGVVFGAPIEKPA